MMQIYTNHEFRPIRSAIYSVGQYVEDETGWKHYIGDFDRVRRGHELYGSWHGIKADSLGTGTVIYLNSDGDSALIGTYVISGEV